MLDNKTTKALIKTNTYKMKYPIQSSNPSTQILNQQIHNQGLNHTHTLSKTTRNYKNTCVGKQNYINGIRNFPNVEPLLKPLHPITKRAPMDPSYTWREEKPPREASL